VVIIYLCWLVVTTTLRVLFPWDLHFWPESPFMTNMLKLDQHQPIFGPPAEANSFVYSPGLENICFVILKPFGLHLDIRFCRAVNVGLGVLAGILAGLCFRQIPADLVSERAGQGFAWLGGGVAILVVFRNFTADITHPDNLVMLHTAGLFLLTVGAVEKRSFGLALAAMVFAGLGVFAKQILMSSFLGPAFVFVRHLKCDWRRCGLLMIVGSLASLAALAILWREPFARFYTWEVLSRQGLHLTQLYWIVQDSLHADRALLWTLGMASSALLGSAGPAGKRYLEIWFVLGVCSVWPNAVSYLKQMGTWNNLIIFQLWLLLVVWPALGWWLSHAQAGERGSNLRDSVANRMDAAPGAVARDWRLDVLLAVLVTLFVLLLLPTRLPPNRSMYAACESVQKRVDADIEAGRKVLVAHGMMFQIRAGSHQIPLDRANSNLELMVAGLEDRARTATRIREGFYDRIYLTVPDWYGPAVLSEIETNYVLTEVIPKPHGGDRSELGRSLSLIGDCKILSRR
jgi:hypothetical protein